MATLKFFIFGLNGGHSFNVRTLTAEAKPKNTNIPLRNNKIVDSIPKLPPKYAKYSRLIKEMIKRGYQFVEYDRVLSIMTFFNNKKEIYFDIYFGGDQIQLRDTKSMYIIWIDYLDNLIKYIVEDTKIEYTIIEYGIPPEFLLENILNTIDGILYFPSFVLYKIRILGAEAKPEKIQLRVK